MRSPSRTHGVLTMWRALLIGLVFTCAAPMLAAAQESPSEPQVAAAVEKLQADPNLATDRTVRVLRWKDKDEPRKKGAWLQWLAELIRWVAQTGRIIVWLTVGVLAAVLVLFIIRFVRQMRPGAIARRFEAPTHVRDLDIRPESLPDDVGASALELWQRGEHRASLSLLYRGLLSRLVHVHGLPIRHSTTENDCIELAMRHLQADRAGYVSRLVRVWQMAVYGGHEPRMEDVQQLCAGFAEALAPPPKDEPVA